jgi:putative cardiolipin synthase
MPLRRPTPVALLLPILLLSAACSHTVAYRLVHGDLRPGEDACAELPEQGPPRLSETLEPFGEQMAARTGTVVLEDGGGAMAMRAWLSDAAEKSIDIQYFIFSADNVGLIALDYLLRAAERGIVVRMLVDDLLVDGDSDLLWLIDAHPYIEVRIYNPNINIGKTIGQKLKKTFTDFRGINQRMHNKAFIVDGKAVITGGRNVADEYFDYNREFNFRDRDVLLLGGAAAQVRASFEEFWESRYSVPVSRLLDPPEKLEPELVWERIHQYACDPSNFWLQARARIEAVPTQFADLERSERFQWVDGIRYVSDVPGKNDEKRSLGGGGLSTDALLGLIREARKSIVIQTPYLVTTGLSRGPLKEAAQRGVAVRILTNSLGSTDNLAAFSGYARDRDKLLATGAEVYEFKPDAEVRKTAMTSALAREVEHLPVFGLHAKTMVVDEEILVVGTFNMDPRSANLNTECVTIIRSPSLAGEVQQSILEEMGPDNAWQTTRGANPDSEAGCGKRFKLWWHGILPKSIL